MITAEDVPGHLKERFDALLRLQPTELPHPWHEVVSLSVGGLTRVGFDDKSEYLLIVSHDGLGVLDCCSGERVAREDDDAHSVDPGTLVVDGIGPISDHQIRMSGILGGGLPNSSVCGWTVDELIISHWSSALFLFFGQQTLFWPESGKLEGVFRLPESDEKPVAFGFSPNGHVLVVASSSLVTLYHHS